MHAQSAAFLSDEGFPALRVFAGCDPYCSLEQVDPRACSPRRPHREAQRSHLRKEQYPDWTEPYPSQ